MNLPFIQPPQVAWASGALANGPLIRKSTLLHQLDGVFADRAAFCQCDPQQCVYDVEMFDSPSADGALYVGVTHLYPGKVGNEYFMTRGHFHKRREQGEVYFGLRGSGLLLLQDQQGEARLENVAPGSVHIIPGFTAHRLINTGTDTLSALAVWPCSAGHDYASLSDGFALRITDENEVRHD